VVFQLTQAIPALDVQIIYIVYGANYGRRGAHSSVIFDASGNLYSTTQIGDLTRLSEEIAHSLFLSKLSIVGRVSSP